MRKFLSLALALLMLSTVSYGQVGLLKKGNAQDERANFIFPTKQHSANKSVANVKSINSNFIHFSEGFEDENALDTWTLINTDGDQVNWDVYSGDDLGHNSQGTALSFSWVPTGQGQGVAVNPDEWMITPAIDLTSASAGTVIKFWVSALHATYAAEKYSVYVSTSGNTVEDFTGDNGTTLIDGEVLSSDAWIEKSFDAMSYVGNTIYIGFRHHDCTDQFAIRIDDIEVSQPYPLDIELTSLDTDTYLESDNAAAVDIEGTVKNIGIEDITSYDVTYTIDGGEASAVYSVTGINLAPGQTHEFTHDVQVDLSTIGVYTVEITISNVNGGSESSLEDNVANKEVFVVSELVQKKVFYELFTSSTCGPCAQANPAIDAVLLNGNNEDKAVLIKYQVHGPGTGDPYFTAEASERLQYYDVDAVPTLMADGAPDGNYSQAYLDAQAGVMSLFKIEGEATFADGNMTANINVTPVFTFNKDLVLQIAVIEKETTGNVGTNGETEFHNVMMKFIENPSGNAISSFEASTVQNVTVSTSLTGTNVEELSDTRLVVWIQDHATKEVYQAQYIELTTEIVDAKLMAVNTVASSCDLPADAEVKAVVKNTGGSDISNFTVAYTVNGTEVGTTTYTETLAVGEDAEVIFDQTADLSADGTYEIQATVTLEGDLSADNNTASVTVLNTAPENANGYTETFASTSGTWTIENANDDDRTWLLKSGYLNQQGATFGHNDTTAMAYFYSGTRAADDYLYTNCLEFEAGKSYKLSFWYRIGDAQYPEKLEVRIGTENSKDAMTETIVDLGQITNISYTQSEASFTVSETGVYYIGFHVYSDADKFLLLVDDISVSENSGIEPQVTEGFNIYPNPTTGLVKVEGVEGAQVVVYNMVGEVVYNEAKASERVTIDLSSYNAGNYIVKVIDNNKVSTQKITLTK